LVTTGNTEDQALANQIGQGVAKGGGAHGTEFAQLFHRNGAIEAGQGFSDTVGWTERAGGGRVQRASKDFQSQSRTVLSQLDGKGIGGGGGTVFSGEGESILLSAQVEVGVAPAVEFARSAQGLSGPGTTGILAGVVHDHHGELVLALKFAQEA
jgi:hypothetical protein